MTRSAKNLQHLSCRTLLALLRAGYDSDLNIEGWHDPVYRDHGVNTAGDAHHGAGPHQPGQRLEDAGLLIGRRTLEQFVPKEA